MKEVLNQFKSIKENGANEVFKTELGKKTYQEIKEINDSALNINKETSEEEFQSFIDSMKKNSGRQEKRYHAISQSSIPRAPKNFK